MDQARDLAFGGNIPYVAFSNSEKFVLGVQLQEAMNDFLIQVAPVLDPDFVGGISKEDAVSMFNQPIIRNTIGNIATVGVSVNQLVRSVVAYMIGRDVRLTVIADAINYGAIVLAIITYTTVLIVQLRWLQRDKNEVYGAMLSLPKNCVSQLSENLHNMKGVDLTADTGAENDENSKVDENLIKLFNTGGTGHSGAGSLVGLIANSLVVVVLNIVITVQLASALKSCSRSAKNHAPQLNNVLGAYTMFLGSLAALEQARLCHLAAPGGALEAQLGIDLTGTGGPKVWHPELVPPYHLCNQADPINTLLAVTQMASTAGRDFWHDVLFGAAENSPLDTVWDSLKSAENECPDDFVYAATTDYDARRYCLGSGEALTVLMTVLESRPIMYWAGAPTFFNEDYDPDFGVSWWSLIVPLYDDLFVPMFEAVMPSLNSFIETTTGRAYPIAIVLVIVALVDEFIAFEELSSIDAHLRGVLSLFLHVDPGVLATTRQVIKILAGDFSMQANKDSNEEEFFSWAFEALPDAVVFADSETMEIEGANPAALKLFGAESLVGMDLREVFDLDVWPGVTDELFVEASTVQISTNAGDFEVTSAITFGSVVLSFVNVTAAVKVQTLINPQPEKMCQLLARVLPDQLVMRVQEGETGISFAVQSASILFFDVINFSAAGDDPRSAMSTLNHLFQACDAEIACLPSLTRLKSIGDRYMAGGGLFSEISQPGVFTKEIVGFGLTCIGSAKTAGQQIRVGVNTGGPVAAGVVATAKPSFDVIGPTVALAQELEREGVAGNVHIPRAVYELIYGGDFIVKEKGQTETRQGSLITYVVTGRK